MLNMLLAIVMDVYTEVKSSIGSDAETLWSQAREIYRRWRELRRGNRVSLNHILVYIAPENTERSEEEELDTKLTVKSFLAMVPRLGERQAQRVLVAAQALYAHES